MCGIIAIFHYGENKTTVNEKAVEMMQDQIARGTRGFGSVYIDEKLKFKVMRATGETKMLVDNHFNPSKMVIMHHRQPTSSDNKISQTHPIKVENKSLKFSYLIVHNGVIRNDEELKTQHETEGYKYTTDDQDDKRFNDSECLAIEVAKFIEKQTDKIGAVGSCAFVAIQYNKKTKTVEQIFYGRDNINPLKLAKSRTILYLSSESKGEEIKANTLYNFNLTDFKIGKRDLIFATTIITTNTNEQTTLPEKIHKTRNPVGYLDDPEEINDYETSELVENGKTVISEELDKLYEAMMKRKEIWNMDLDQRLRQIAATMIQQTKQSFNIASEYFADIVLQELETEKQAQIDKELEKDMGKDTEIGFKTEEKKEDSVIEKYYSR